MKIAMLKGAPSVAQFLYKFGISVDLESLGKCFESCDGNDENCKMDCIIALTDIAKSGSLELLGFGIAFLNFHWNCCSVLHE